MPLQGFIDSSSNSSAITGAIKVKSDYLSSNLLIANNNPFAINQVNAIKNHFNSSRVLTQDEVNTYLASSTLLHALDSWTYFSHAIESLLKGDVGIAIHLSYYSELRATMSFLAAEGIGILDHQHFCVTNTNAIVQNPIVYNQRKKIPSGTHQFTWDAIEKWSSSTTKPNSEILKVFSVHGKNFEDWANAFPYNSNSNAILIVRNWLKEWNLDVRYFRNDRSNRNNVSYRPQRLINNPQSHSFNQIIDTLGSFWKLLEPNQSSKFHILDKYLLRIFIQEIYKSLSETIRLRNSLESLIIDTLNNLGLNHDSSLINFLKDTSTITHNIFLEAKKDAIDVVTGTLNAIPIIARSLLMLRISTGNASLIFKKASVKNTDLNFLWEKFGVENGLWDSGNAPQDFDELWDNIKDYIDDTITLSDLYSPDLSLSKIYAEEDMPVPFNYFKQFQRAALWGIAV